MGSNDAYHVIWNTLSSWLPGNNRGFRNRDHRIHSSGDYRDPPPLDEHLGLLRYNQRIARPTVRLPPSLRPLISNAVREAASRQTIRIACISVASEHVHLLGRAPGSYEELNKLVGQIKTVASLAVREQLPGSIWSRGCTRKRIKDARHWNAARVYITDKQERGAYVWDYERGEWWVE